MTEEIKEQDENSPTQILSFLDNSESLDDSSIIKPMKPKRILTEKQIASLQEGRKKGREKLNEKHKEIQEKKSLALSEKEELRMLREEKAKMMLENEKKKTEEYIVKKAVSIKKREVKLKKAMEQIEDDDTPMEEIKKIIAKKPVKEKEKEKEKEELQHNKKTIESYGFRFV